MRDFRGRWDTAAGQDSLTRELPLCRGSMRDGPMGPSDFSTGALAVAAFAAGSRSEPHPWAGGCRRWHPRLYAATALAVKRPLGR